jgi:hypothetical protein
VRNESSTFQTSSIFRHKNPEECPVLAIAMYLFVKYGSGNHIREIVSNGEAHLPHPISLRSNYPKEIIGG